MSSMEDSNGHSSTDRPSQRASNTDGIHTLDAHFRSVLSHPLCLPLLYSLHGKDPYSLKYLQQRSAFPENSDWGDAVMESAVELWRQHLGKQNELSLTTLLTEKIKELDEKNFTAVHQDKVGSGDGDGHVDISFRSNDKDKKALAVLEVGLDDSKWWSKVSQGVSYLRLMSKDVKESKEVGLRFKDPLLLVVMTVDKQSLVGNNACKVKLGVFFCAIRNVGKPDFRVSLLWHDKLSTVQEASKAFGKVLRAVSDFHRWMTSGKKCDYEYLSSTCCRVGDKVLRCYDDRFRKTERSPDIYLKNDPDIVRGEGVVSLEPVSKSPDDRGDKGDHLWQAASRFQIIATPFIEGTHKAESPKDFVSVIEQLEKMHKENVVHGDIRGFNVVFLNGHGHLIDFDLGGTAGVRMYPKGYVDVLRDGNRPGKEKEVIEKWHDWLSLGRLIFWVHRVEGGDDMRLYKISQKWTDLRDAPTSKEVEELKNLLSGEGYTIRPSLGFEGDLESKGEGTRIGATGSPPKL